MIRMGFLVVSATLLIAPGFAGDVFAKPASSANPGVTKCRIARGACNLDCDMYTGTLKTGCKSRCTGRYNSCIQAL